MSSEAVEVALEELESGVRPAVAMLNAEQGACASLACHASVSSIEHVDKRTWLFGLQR